MSTNANISVVHADQTVSTVYLHWDGYPSHALETLTKHYTTIAQAEELVSLGAISVLAESIDCPRGHSFEKPVRGHTIAYHRDRDDELHINKFADVGVCIRDSRQQYHYMFKFGKWHQVTERDINMLMCNK